MHGFAAVGKLVTGLVEMLTRPPYSHIGLWLLVGVFIWSGTVKVRQPALAALAMVDFRVVRRSRSGYGLALGVAELTLALGLVVLPRQAMTVASLLLWLFVFLIFRSLHAGERFACFCFGDGGGHLSSWTLARTTALALLATLIAIGTSRPTALHRIDHTVLAMVSASALLGGITLISYTRSLLRWNRNLFE